ncbi:phage antirepressor KilAC domain-containing protein [Streptomyces fungicidicus]|uniref:phage antirepressor KilAC domain-containing protein n=1 Tax=Streptomyces fungicidicus TaxID=68203 RepID=UPI00332B4130
MSVTHPTSEMALVESRSLRDRTIENVYVLDKIKVLATLPDGLHVSTGMLAVYFEVPAKTIESVVEDNRAELEENGYRVLRGPELAPYKGGGHIGLRAASMALFSRRAVLNVAMLLRDSEIAREVRTYLLDAEAAQRATSTSEFKIPSSFAEALELAAAQARELEQAAAALEAAAPKIEAHDRLIADGDDRILRTIAAELRVKEHWLRQQLVEWSWVYVRTADCGALQYAAYASKRDFFAVKEREIPHHSREDCWHATLLVTPRGREAIRRKLDKQNVEPAALAPSRAIAPTPTEAEVFQMIRRGA